MLLLSLAVSDLLVGLLSMPGEIRRQTSCWSYGALCCVLYNFVSYVVTSASVGHMVLISADRYVAVCEPLRYAGRVTAGRARRCVLLCWLCSLLYAAAFIRDDFVRPDRHGGCLGECVIGLEPLAAILDLLLTFLLPVATIVLLYTRVFVAAVAQARAARSQVAALNRSLPRTKKSELKAARTLGVLVLVFLVCFCPFYCVHLAAGDMLTKASAFFVSYLFYFNSSLNPLIYTLFYPWFRRAARLILTLQVLQPGSRTTKIL